VGSSTAKLLIHLGPSLIVVPTSLLPNWMEKFDNLFNGNLMGLYLAMALLIKYTSVLSVQKPSYKRNITKLITVKAAIVKSDKDIYIGHSN
jgi:SNF2 family DNA or RNA helicase